MTTTTMASVLLTLPLLAGACTTTREDVAQTERSANETTEAAYNRADEKARQAQDVAEEKTVKAVDEADKKIEAAQNKADRETEKAYEKADKVETKQDKKVETTRQRQFVDEMSRRLTSRKKAIRAFEKKVTSEGSADKARDQPALSTLRDAQHQAEDQLNKIKKADWHDWATQKPAVQDAFVHLDDTMVQANIAR